MELVKDDFKIINLPNLDKLLEDKEFCIMSKGSHLFYARQFVYPSYGKSFCLDRFLPNLQYNTKTKTVTLTLECEMNYFPDMHTEYLDKIKKIGQTPKDPNSNSALRGYERRLLQLSTREQTPRVVKEIKKLHEKIEAQKEKIKKRNEKIFSN